MAIGADVGYALIVSCHSAKGINETSGFITTAMCSIAVNESIKSMGLGSDWEPSCRLTTYNGGLLKLLGFSRRMRFASFFAAKVDGM
jgi:hypothetical protein